MTKQDLGVFTLEFMENLSEEEVEDFEHAIVIVLTEDDKVMYRTSTSDVADNMELLARTMLLENEH